MLSPPNDIPGSKFVMIGVVIVVVVVLDDEYELKDEKEESGPMSYNDGNPVLTLLLLL